MTRLVVRPVAAALVVAAAGLGVSTPAQAATCSTAKGVSVVVDFHELGGGVQTFCDSRGTGKTADAQLRDAGHALTYVQREPGFICRIDGKPADDPCVDTPPSDAYWSLWWSDGKSGTWTFSAQGASSLKVPQGGYVAMSWQGSSSKAPPRAAPSPHASTPSASPSTHSASPAPSGSTHSSPTTTSPTTAPTVSPSASPSRSRHATVRKIPPKKRGDVSKHAHPRPTPQPGKTQAAAPVDRMAVTAAGSGSGLPAWVAPAVVVAMFAAAAAVALVRRRRSGGA